MKKFKLIFSVLLVLSLALAVSACEVDDGPDVKINVGETLELKVGEEKPLGATAEGTENALSYSSANEAIATVSEAGVVKGIAEGKVDITVSAEGVKAICKVTVLPANRASLAFIGDVIKDADNYKVYLAPAEKAPYNDLASELPLAVEVKLNDQPVENPQINWSSDHEEIAKYEEGKILALAPGAAVLTAAYGEQKLMVAVHVLAEEKLEERQELDMSADAVVALSDAVAVNRLMAGENALEGYLAEEAGLKLTPACMKAIAGENKYGEAEIVAYSESKVCCIPLNLVTKILRTKEDAIKMMELARGNQAVPENGNSVATEQKAAQPDYYDEADGYFVLAANIDMEGDVIRFCHKDGVFKGIIDGRGHAIFNIGSLEYKLLDNTKVRLTNANAGIFGQLGGTLKNIALVNVVCGKDEASPVDEECHRNIAIAYKVLPSAVIENVYLTFVQSEGTGGTTDGSGAMGCIDEGATLAKIVIEAINKPNNMRSRGANDTEIINTIGRTSNEDKTTIAGICGETGQYFPVGTKFRCYQDIIDGKGQITDEKGNAQNSKLNLAGYDEEYWDISKGFPTFKGVMEDMAAETDLKILGMPVLFTATGDGMTANVSKAGLAGMGAGANRFYMNSTSKYMMSYRFPEGKTLPEGVVIDRNYVKKMENFNVGDTFTVIAYNPHVDGIEFSIKLTVVE